MPYAYIGSQSTPTGSIQHKANDKFKDKSELPDRALVKNEGFRSGTNYTTVNIPSGVKVTFKKNPANTAVVMLATGAVKIAGTIDISGESAPTTKAGALINGLAGLGGPGGFDGGLGGLAGTGRRSGIGFGPGGGGGATNEFAHCGNSSYGHGGGGGGFSAAGERSFCAITWGSTSTGAGGVAYGSVGMLPLVGG